MRNLRKSIAAAALGAAMAAAPLASALAGDGAAAITERQALMDLLPGNLMVIKMAIDSKDAKRMTAAAKQAGAIEHAAHAIPTMFPKGSDMKAGKTGALDKIWSDEAGFKKAADVLAEKAKALGEALKGGDAGKALAAFGTMGKEGCGGCHGAYRAKN
ncbi:MAG: cytochrome c [Rhodospirillaceae bacterium]|nr:cytochrome c [Rhodospirillaceae bacterium]